MNTEAPALPRTVAVLGLGLVGGSLARDLSALGARVLVLDRDEESMRDALRQGAAHGEIGPSGEGLGSADLVVLAVPVAAAGALLQRVLPRLSERCVVTDVGSTKRGIQRAAAELGLERRWVGSHPMAGDHRSGWAASRSGLFAGSRVYLCPAATSSPEAVGVVRALWRAVGAEPVDIGAEEHDRVLAWTSHLPQVASTLLAVALDGAGHSPGELGPGGRDVTRLAGSSPEMWTAICQDNADLLEPALTALQHRVEQMRDALRRGDFRAVEDLFTRGARWTRT